MSIQAGDFRLSFERVSASESIHRVERETTSRDFGKKNREHKKDQEPDDLEYETPQDVVEVAGHDSTDTLSKLPSESNQAASHQHGITVFHIPDGSDRRIDIKV